MELGAPKLVTVRVIVTVLLMLGMVMEGWLTSRMEGLLSGHVVGSPVSREMAESLYPIAQR